jgi:hypothetical protein
MKEIIIKYCKGEPLQITEAVSIIEEYMHYVKKYNRELIIQLLNPMNPMGRSMLDIALQTSMIYLQWKYSINKLYSKDGQLLMVF